MILGISSFGGFPKNDCRRCLCDPGIRRDRGCDEDAPRALESIPCLNCNGQDQSCQECEGTGYVKIYRCPKTSLPEDVKYVASFYTQWMNGTLPVTGGILDQTVSYFHAMKILEAAEAEMRQRQTEQSQKPTAPKQSGTALAQALSSRKKGGAKK